MTSTGTACPDSHADVQYPLAQEHGVRPRLQQAAHRSRRAPTTDEPFAVRPRVRRSGAVLPRRASEAREITRRSRNSTTRSMVAASRNAPLCPRPCVRHSVACGIAAASAVPCANGRDIVFLVVHHQHRDAHDSAPRRPLRWPRRGGRSAPRTARADRRAPRTCRPSIIANDSRM